MGDDGQIDRPQPHGARTDSPRAGLARRLVEGPPGAGAGVAFDPSACRDLHGLPSGAVAAWPPPDEQDTVATLAARMHTDLERLTDTVVQRVVDEVEAYRDEVVVVRGDLWWSCYRNAELVLQLLIEDRRVREEELRVRRALGVRRAQQGLPIEDVLQAFHVGCLVLWEEVLRMAQHRGHPATRNLLERVGMIWTHMHDIATAVAQTHRMELSRRDALSQQGIRGFLRSLAQWPLVDAAIQHARDLGFDPAGPFLAAVHRGQTIRSRLPGAGAVLQEPDRAVVMWVPDRPPAEAERALAGMLAEAGAEVIGIGVCRTGIDGARDSLRDAERAHAAAVHTGVGQLTYRTGWFTAMALDAQDELAAVAGDVVAVIADEPDLRDTLTALLEHGGRIAETARALRIHPNTVSYRLDRFCRRTGVDARSLDGVMTVRLALTLLGR